MARGDLVTGAAIAALLLLVARAAAAAPRGRVIFGEPWIHEPDDGSTWSPGDGYHDPVYDAPDEGLEATDAGTFEPAYYDPFGAPVPSYYHGAGGPMDTSTNLEAFLEAIIAAEHYPVDVISGDAYRTFYGGAKFNSYADHPVITGELRPKELTRAQCARLGYSGKCYSTAAGAFQLIKPTWLRIRSKGAYLADFTPESQREAARRLLRELGVDQLLAGGHFTEAVQRASSLWASLPGSTAGQGGKSLAFVQQKYREAGGAGVA